VREGLKGIHFAVIVELGVNWVAMYTWMCIYVCECSLDPTINERREA